MDLITADSMDRLAHFDFKYNGATQAFGTLYDFPQARGPYVFTTLANREQAGTGFPSPRDGVATVIPIKMEALLGFGVQGWPDAALSINQAAKTQGQAAMTNLDLKVILRGSLRRNVAGAGF